MDDKQIAEQIATEKTAIIADADAEATKRGAAYHTKERVAKEIIAEKLAEQIVVGELRRKAREG